MIGQFITISVDDILRRLDDAIDYRTMSRREALKFLERMAEEIEIRTDWVREAIKKDEGS